MQRLNRESLFEASRFSEWTAGRCIRHLTDNASCDNDKRSTVSTGEWMSVTFMCVPSIDVTCHITGRCAHRVDVCRAPRRAYSRSDNCLLSRGLGQGGVRDLLRPEPGWSAYQRDRRCSGPGGPPPPPPPGPGAGAWTSGPSTGSGTGQSGGTAAGHW